VAQALTLSDIAALVDGDIQRGDSVSSYDGLASLDEAGPSDVSFLGNPKYLLNYERTAAGVVLITKEVPITENGAALVIVENPTFAFSKIIDHFKSALTRPEPGIHPSAVVEPGAMVAKSAIIGPCCVVGQGAVIGENTHLTANVSVTQLCEIGDNVMIHPGSVIGSDGFGYEFIDGKLAKIDQVGLVVIENDVEIGANCTVDRARFGKTIIGEGTKIDNLVQIGHNVQIGKHCILVSQCAIAGSTIIGDYVTIAAQAGVSGHLNLGDKFTLTARGGLTKDGPSGEVWMGKPARPMRQELKKEAQIARLGKLGARVKALEKKLEE